MSLLANSELGLGDEDETMNEINMIPFIDVMLVLLIVFIITVPVLHHSVNVQLPQASNQKEDLKPETLNLSVRADGSYWLGEDPVSDEVLEARLQTAASEDPQPALHIRGDRDVRYERVAQAMAAAQRVGLSKIGFVTSPDSVDTAASGKTPETIRRARRARQADRSAREQGYRRSNRTGQRPGQL